MKVKFARKQRDPPGQLTPLVCVLSLVVAVGVTVFVTTFVASLGVITLTTPV